MKTARDLMTSPAECLSSDETLVTAARMLSKYDIGSMPVVDGDELVGILTDRDIVVQGVSKGLDLSTATVGEIATSDVVTVEPDAGADAVAKLMSENQVRRLPVVDRQRPAVRAVRSNGSPANGPNPPARVCEIKGAAEN